MGSIAAGFLAANAAAAAAAAAVPSAVNAAASQPPFTLSASLGLGGSQGACGASAAASAADVEVVGQHWEDLCLGSSLDADLAVNAAEAAPEDSLGPLADWGMWGGPWNSWPGNYGLQLGGLSPGASSLCVGSPWPQQSVHIAQQDDPWQQIGRVVPDPSGSPSKAYLRAVRTSESTLCTLADERL